MTTATPPAWNVFKQIFAEHWDGFQRVHPRYDRRDYAGLVDQMLGGGDPGEMGDSRPLSGMGGHPPRCDAWSILVGLTLCPSPWPRGQPRSQRLHEGSSPGTCPDHLWSSGPRFQQAERC
jgi:hypothetical protein